MAWLAARLDFELFVAAVVLAEIQFDIERTRQRDALKAAEKEAWLNRLAATPTVVTMDGSDFRLWVRLMDRKSRALVEDAIIAAIVLNRSLTVATRYVRDFTGFGVPTFNLFAA